MKSLHSMKRVDQSTFWIIGAMILSVISVHRARAQPYAHEPLPRPTLSVDLGSPTATPPLSADDILFVENDGVPPPGELFDALGLGLGLPGDDLDGLSRFESSSIGNNGFQPKAFALLFTVDRSTVGAVDPLFNQFPFNVKQQASLGQAAGDEYAALAIFQADGTIQFAQKNNTMVGNQADIGGIDGASAELVPNVDPLFDATLLTIDALDAVTRPVLGEPIFFTLTSASPSLLTLPGDQSGADIYYDPDPTASGDEAAYAEFDNLDLMQDDDIDALHVFDNGDFVFDKNTDQVIFSLAPGSPSLALLGVGPADVLTTTSSLGGPSIAVFANAIELGLCPEDNVGGLDVYEADDLVDLICRAAVRAERVGDANGDCVVDPLDAGFVQARFGCPVLAGDQSCNSADQNNDGVVDPLDLGYVMARLGETVFGEGACCTTDGVCVVQGAVDCIRSEGLYRGDGTLCEPDSCVIIPQCPDSGDCCVPHDSPGCNDPDCQTIICQIDPSCCEGSWHPLCAQIAGQICPVCND